MIHDDDDDIRIDRKIVRDHLHNAKNTRFPFSRCRGRVNCDNNNPAITLENVVRSKMYTYIYDDDVRDAGAQINLCDNRRGGGGSVCVNTGTCGRQSPEVFAARFSTHVPPRRRLSSEFPNLIRGPAPVTITRNRVHVSRLSPGPNNNNLLSPSCPTTGRLA